MDIESVQTLDDLIAGVLPEAEPESVGTPSEESAPDPSPVQEQPPAIEPVSNAAEPAADVAAEPTVDPSSDPEPTPEPNSLNWDSDENPYRSQATQLTEALRLAAQNVQRQREAEDMAARQRLIDELPNMDPDRARLVVAQLQAWDQQQAQARIQAQNVEFEPIAKELAIRKLAERFSLTAEERQKLEQFADARQAEWAASEMATSRRDREKQLSEYRNQIAELKLKVEAQERLNSPVDRVAVGAGGPAAIPSDANDIDEFVASLNLPTASRWA